MERLLVLRLEAVGCTAEALLNGMPLARVGAGCRVLTVPVHEFTLAGSNELELVVAPPAPGGLAAVPQAVLSDGQAMASLRLLLPRVGSTAHPASARTLAQLDWVVPADELYETPVLLHQRVDLPIGFPRWRWLDAPVIDVTPDLKHALVAYLLKIAVGLAKGNPESLVQASRLRLESIAQAYQRNLADEVGRLRLYVQQAHAVLPLRPVLPALDTLWLRPVAQGRLLECLGMDGLPALRCPRPGGGLITWPLRVGLIDGMFYGLA
jgi:hypothetical protein